MNSSKKKILITGGSGFIGTHLARALLNSGHEVIILDLVRSQLEPQPNLTTIIGDIRNTEDLDRVITPAIDVVFHFAAIVSVPLCENNPQESFETNVIGTQNILKRLHTLLPTKKIPIFFASSAAVYGDLCKDGQKLKESDHLPKPLSFYGLQKYNSEQSVRLYAEKHGLPGLAFRFFNIFGSGQNPDSPYSGVITLFKRALEQKLPVKLYNQGKNSRDFIHVSEITRACVLALHLPIHALDGKSINLCTGKAILIVDTLKSMEALHGPAVAIELLPPRDGDIQRSCGDASLAQKELGFVPNKLEIKI